MPIDILALRSPVTLYRHQIFSWCVEVVDFSTLK